MGLTVSQKSLGSGNFPAVSNFLLIKLGHIQYPIRLVIFLLGRQSNKLGIVLPQKRRYASYSYMKFNSLRVNFSGRLYITGGIFRKSMKLMNTFETQASGDSA